MKNDFIKAATAIAIGYVTQNPIDPDEIPDLVERIAGALATVGRMQDEDEAVHVSLPDCDPAVPIAESVTDDYLVCLEDGRRLKMLKRHLRARYGLSPEQYRERWRLPAAYPMTAPAYARQRRRIAQTTQGGFRRTGP